LKKKKNEVELRLLSNCGFNKTIVLKMSNTIVIHKRPSSIIIAVHVIGTFAVRAIYNL